MNILSKIAERTYTRIAEERRKMPLAELRVRAEEAPCPQGFPFEAALREEGVSFICEVKKASPSKGVIDAVFPYTAIAQEYERAGASAISCLTEPYWFQGRDQYLKEIAARVSIPVLRKDFTVDEYMVYQARAMGASAILLICSILEDERLKSYLRCV